MTATVIQSRRPRPSAATRCTECKVAIEFSIPVTPSSTSESDGPSYQVQCFSCLTINTVKKDSLRVQAAADPDAPPINRSTSSSTTNGYAGSGRSSTTSNGGGFGYQQQQQQSQQQQQEQQQQQQQQKKKNSKAFGKMGLNVDLAVPFDYKKMKNPVDREYYDLLGVEVSATPAQIKKAYYAMAIKHHPDKNRDDPHAEETFKKISEAYQVLSDPARRSAYNMYGNNANGNSDSVFIDPEEFFKQQFGGGRFTDIIGEISIAKDFRDAMAMMSKDGGADESKPDNMMGPEDRIEVRQARISTLEAKLITKLLVYTESFPYPENGNPPPVGATFEQLATESLDNFRNIVMIEADGLRRESYGVELLHAIGYTYSLKASQHAAKIDAEEGPMLKRAFGIGSRWMGVVREKAHIVGETVGTFKTAIDLQTSFAKLQEMEKKKDGKKKEDAAVGEPGKENGTATKGDGVDAETKKKDATSTDDDEEYQMTAEERELRQKLEADAASKGLEALWRGSKLEVESVLREVCDRVLGDEKASREIRRRRVEALRVLGSVYESVRPLEDESKAKKGP